MTLASEIEALQIEANGLMCMHVIREIDTPPMMHRAMQGDAEAMSLSLALVEILARIKNAPNHKPMLCGCCPKPLRQNNFAVVIVTPERADPSRCLSLGVCKGCAVDPDSIRTKTVIALRRIWPDARPVTIGQFREAGHA